MVGPKATPEQLALYNAKAAILEYIGEADGHPVEVRRKEEGCQDAALTEYDFDYGCWWEEGDREVNARIASWLAEQWIARGGWQEAHWRLQPIAEIEDWQLLAALETAQKLLAELAEEVVKRGRERWAHLLRVRPE